MKQTFLKYSGSKRFVAEELSRRFPEHDRFVDLTVGGGSILLYSNKPKLISDINPDVINAYKLVKDNPQTIFNSYLEDWTICSQNTEHFYKVRDRFNEARLPQDFIFLSRTVYNGLIRYNSKGLFNSSFMHKRKGIEPAKLLKIIEFWHSFLQNVDIKCGDYEEVYTPQAKDFLFLDSPYLGTSSQYLSDAKNFDFERLKSFLQKLDNHGIKFMCCLDDKIPKDFLPFYNFKTTAKSSSFSRHKGIDKKVGDTIFINY